MYINDFDDYNLVWLTSSGCGRLNHLPRGEGGYHWREGCIHKKRSKLPSTLNSCLLRQVHLDMVCCCWSSAIWVVTVP